MVPPDLVVRDFGDIDGDGKVEIVGVLLLGTLETSLYRLYIEYLDLEGSHVETGMSQIVDDDTALRLVDFNNDDIMEVALVSPAGVQVLSFSTPLVRD